MHRSASSILPLCAALLCACGGPGSTRADAPGPTAGEKRPESTAGVAPDAHARLLAATDLDGGRVGPGPADTRFTLVIVFASWCGHCRRELAVLDELRRELPHVRILGVNAYEEWNDLSDQERLRTFLRESAPWLRVIRADDAIMTMLGTPRKVPSMFVFDAHGNLVEAFVRARRPVPDESELRRVLAGADPGYPAAR